MEIIENRKSSYTYKDNPDINPDIFTETPSIYRINPDMNPDILCSLSPFIAMYIDTILGASSSTLFL